MAANEAAAVAACKAYAEAQEIYRRTDWNQDGVLEYAQSLGGDFSLYEKTAGKGDVKLVDQDFVNAECRGEVPGSARAPKFGYVLKILKAQGPKAPGGQRSYLEENRMAKGYALVACPFVYNGTGRNTFLINHNGTVYECDLGPETHKIVNQMTEFNPDPKQGWKQAD